MQNQLSILFTYIETKFHSAWKFQYVWILNENLQSWYAILYQILNILWENMHLSQQECKVHPSKYANEATIVKFLSFTWFKVNIYIFTIWLKGAVQIYPTNQLSRQVDNCPNARNVTVWLPKYNNCPGRQIAQTASVVNTMQHYFLICSWMREE